MRDSHLILLALFASLLYVQAQEAPERTWRIVFPEHPNDSPKSAYFFNGKESHEGQQSGLRTFLLKCPIDGGSYTTTTPQRRVSTGWR